MPIPRHILIFVLLSCAGTTAQATDDCNNYASQTELNLCASDEYRKLDKELNQIYNQLISIRHPDPDYQIFVERLREAQRAWLKFRDTHMASLFNDSSLNNGTTQRLCMSLEMQRLTAARVKELKALLAADENDVCSKRIASE